MAEFAVARLDDLLNWGRKVFMICCLLDLLCKLLCISYELIVLSIMMFNNYELNKIEFV